MEQMGLVTPLGYELKCAAYEYNRLKAVTLFDGGRDEMVLSVIRLELRAKKRRLCFARARKTAAGNSYRTNVFAEEYELDPRFRGVRDFISYDELGKSTEDSTETFSTPISYCGNTPIFQHMLCLRNSATLQYFLIGFGSVKSSSNGSIPTINHL